MASSSQTNEKSNMEMNEFVEATKVVLERVQQMDPENASRIVGHLLLQEHGEQDVTNLAHVPDDIFTSLIVKTMEELNLSPKTNRNNKQPIVSKLSNRFTPFVPSSSRFPRVPPVNNVQIDSYAPMYQPVINNFEYAPVPYFEQPSNGAGLHYHPQFLPLEAEMEHPFHNVPGQARNAGSSRGPIYPDMRFHQQLNDGYYPKQEVGECQIAVQGWIKKLEIELIDILKSKGPLPVPIASLPAKYSENFGRKLLNFMQAKFGCGLHELLAQMSPRIRMIERSSGELCVMLSEDIPKYVKSVEEKKEHEHAADPSCKIFLTFSFQSTFTSQDIYEYFTTIGPVRGVRIPSQVKRMYGFVTFAYAATVAVALSIGNPHYIRGMQVLVKPHRGNEIFTDRKSDDKIKFSVWSLSDEDSVRLTKVRLGINVPKMQLRIEEHGQSVDLGIKTENTASPSHISSMVAESGPSAPRGVSISSTDMSRSTMINGNEEERYNDKGKSIMTDADEEARHKDKGKSIMTDADEEARCNDKGKSIMTDADEEARYDDINLPDSPFAFEASDYDLAFAMNVSEWEINDSEL